jgi:hypothetical protein
MHALKIPFQRQQQERSETAFGFISLMNQFPAQHNFLKKTLGQVLGLLIVISLMPQVAVDRFPVFLEQITNQIPFAAIS